MIDAVNGYFERNAGSLMVFSAIFDKEAFNHLLRMRFDDVDGKESDSSCHSLIDKLKRRYTLLLLGRSLLASLFNILDCDKNEVYKFSLNNDIATIQSKAAEEKKLRYLEENKELIKERHRVSYQKKKNLIASQETKIETANVQSVPSDNVNIASQVPGEVLTFLMSIVDHNKLAEVQNRLKSIKKEAQLLETVLNLSGNI